MIRLASKLLRITAKVLLIALAAVALLVGLAWTFLQTRHGGELVRRIVVPRVNAALAGSIALGRFAFGGDRLTFEDLVIYDPEGRAVAHVARIDVRFSPLALLRRHVKVKALDIRRPELALVQDERGLNLTRALAPRQAPAERGGAASQSKAGPPRGTIDVKALSLSDGVIDFRSSAGGLARHVHVAELSMRGSAHLSGEKVAADVDVKMRGGRFDARGTFEPPARRGYARARASLRGATLAVDADLDREALAARGRLEATDLAATARGLTRDFDLPRTAISGNGRVEAVAGGTLAAPSLRVTADFPLLAYANTRVRALTAAARIPDLTVPEALDAELSATALALGARTLRSPSVTVKAAGREVSVRAHVAGPQPLHVDLAGRRPPGGARALIVDALQIRYPEVTWTLRGRARLSFGDTIALSGFQLAAGGQRLAADLRLGGRAPIGHVTISQLDLARLPRVLLPPDLGLAGTADVDVRAAGGRAPQVVAKAAVRDGRIRGHRGLSLNLEGQLAGGRARGQLQARGLGTAASARFDLPGTWPPRNLRAPLDVAVDVADADLATVARALDPKPPRVAGRARLSIRLDGQVGKPRLQIAVAGQALAVDDRKLGDLTLTVSGEGNGKLAAHLTSVAPARTRIDVTTPLSLQAILRKPPDAAALARTPFELAGNVDRLPLAVLARVGAWQGTAMKIGGTLSSTLAVSGTLAEPVGTVAIDVAGASAGRFPPTDARVELDFDRGAVGARARVTRKGQALLALESRVGVPPGAVLRPARLAAAPVHLAAVFGPFAMQRLGLPPEDDREAPRELKGKLHADLTIDGTVGAPRAVMHVRAGDISLDKAKVGFAEIQASYADRQAKLDARLTSAGGGTLHAAAAMTADLGYPAVTRGLDARRVPLDVRIDAQRFDLRGLSGVTQSVRTLAGLLTMSGTVRGTLADPRIAGRLEWTDGELALSGFGDYKDIHLAARGDGNNLVLEELAASSGSGRARVVGSATYQTGKGYDVAAQAKLDHFPLYAEGQPLAIVSLTAKLSGRAAPLDTQLKADVEDARIELPDVKRRELQSLQPPHDVVLVDAGRPLNRAQAARLKALTEPAPPRAPGGEASVRLRLKVNAPRNLWVSGKDANLEIGLSPGFRVSVGDETRIFGQVTVQRGRIDIYGRRFDIKSDSTLTFAGDPERPDLDVRAEYVNTTERITVLLSAKGPIDKLAVTVTSPNRPDLTESQLYTLIIAGRLQLGGTTSGGGSPQTQAASLAGGFLASRLQSTLARRLPLDVFTIDVGAEGVRGTKLEAGRYVTNSLYVGYVGRVTSDPTRYQNRNAVHLEYQITPRWAIEAEYGDLGTGTGDLMWKKSY